MNELVIRNWRVTRGVPLGAHLWFDPVREEVRLFRLAPPPDSEGVSEFETALDAEEKIGYLDKVVSVSASEDGDGDVYDGKQISFVEDDAELPF